MWTTEFERFVAPARRAPALWRLGVGIVVIAAMWGFSTMGLFALFGLFGGPDGTAVWTEKLQSGQSPTATILFLLTFIGLAGGTALAARWLHRRPSGSLVGPRQGPAFAAGAAALMLVTVGTTLVPSEIRLQPGSSTDLFLTFLPVALLALLIQAGAEEVAFRGYLQTQLAARFRSPIVWMVLPSLGFGLLHLDPGTNGANAWLVVAATALVGLIAADLTRVTGGIGAAWGLHFANNAVVILVVSAEGPLGGLALWRADIRPDDPGLTPLLWLDMAALVLVWALLRGWFRWRAKRMPGAGADQPTALGRIMETRSDRLEALRAPAQPPI